MRNRLFWLVLSCLLVFSLTSASGESLYELYRTAASDTIVIDDLTIAVGYTPDQILSLHHQEASEIDIYIFPLESVGTSLLLDTLPPLPSGFSERDFPDVLYSFLSRNGQLHAYPLHIEVHTSHLLASTEALIKHGIDPTSIPSKLNEFFLAAISWYQSGQLDGINLIQQYPASEMIVYYALQKYVYMPITAESSSEVQTNELQELLSNALRLASVMEQHHAFSSSSSLFSLPPANYIYTSTLFDNSRNEAWQSYPILANSTSSASGYYVGTIAVLNPYGLHQTNAASFLASQPLSESALICLQHADAGNALGIQSGETTAKAESRILFHYAKELVAGELSIDECVILLER